jgi:hypothetical protein
MFVQILQCFALLPSSFTNCHPLCLVPYPLANLHHLNPHASSLTSQVSREHLLYMPPTAAASLQRRSLCAGVCIAICDAAPALSSMGTGLPAGSDLYLSTCLNS